MSNKKTIALNGIGHKLS